MRTIGTLFLAVLLSLGFAVTCFADIIANSPHNLVGRTGTADSSIVSSLATGEICVYCHTPHQANAAIVDYNPLWNMDATAISYTAYSSATATGTMELDPLAGPSRLCMSCHDGTIAVDNALTGASGGYVAATDDNYINPGKLIGSGETLANDHPIGFTYDAALVTADGELEATGTPSVLGTDTIADHLFGGTIMTCATCHDVHDNANGNFLYVANGSSALCLSCHFK